MLYIYIYTLKQFEVKVVLKRFQILWVIHINYIHVYHRKNTWFWIHAAQTCFCAVWYEQNQTRHCLNKFDLQEDQVCADSFHINAQPIWKTVCLQCHFSFSYTHRLCFIHKRMYIYITYWIELCSNIYIHINIVSIIQHFAFQFLFQNTFEFKCVNKHQTTVFLVQL